MNLKKLIKLNYQQLIFVFLAFFLMVMVSYWSVSGILRKQLFKNAEMEIASAEANIKSKIMESQVTLVNSSITIRNIIDKGGTQQDVLEFFMLLTDWLEDNKDSVAGFNGIYGVILGEFLDGTLWEPPADYVPTERPWYIAAINAPESGIGYTQPYVDAQSGTVIISVSNEIFNGEGESLGILAIDIDITSFAEYVRDLEIAEGGYGILLDSDFNIVMHHNPALINTNLHDINAEFAGIADRLQAGDVISGESMKNVDGVQTTVFYRPLFSGSYVGIITPDGTYYRDLTVIGATLSALGLILMLILSYFLLRLSRDKIRSEEENKSKTSFLATMSHEIRTPMNAIIGIAQIQLQTEGLPQEYASALQQIYSSGNSLLGIINDILDMSKIESGKLELIPVNYDIPSLINDTVQLNIVRIGSKQIEFLLDIDENMPLRLFGDELRLKQIMNNMLSNAIKYTEKGYVKLTVKSVAQGENTLLRFIIEDTGQGMKPEDQERLFSEYMRFNTKANRSTEGTGIGLNITRNLVEMMEGTIKVESEYGKGSLFTVEVMQKTVECDVIGPELAKRLCGFTFAQERHFDELQISRVPMPYGKILIVDDVETNLYVAEGLMLPYKLKIETVTSGFAAIQKVEDGHTYDVIFMDHMMPLMDGIETTKKLRGLGYKGVIVALTANALTGNDTMFKQNGFDDFISKPIDVRHLNACLNTYVRDRHPDYRDEQQRVLSTETSPEEADTPISKTTTVHTDGINPKLLEVFRRDAERAVVTLRETMANGDIKLFTTTVHAMKSALANVGETEASAAAFSLEKAGLDGNSAFIDANVDGFIKTLETLIQNISPAETLCGDIMDVSEDTGYLKEQLLIVIAACEDYDRKTAYTALDLLKEKQWKTETAAVIEGIHDALLLHSDFEGASEQAETFVKTIEN